MNLDPCKNLETKIDLHQAVWQLSEDTDIDKNNQLLSDVQSFLQGLSCSKYKGKLFTISVIFYSLFSDGQNGVYCVYYAEFS